MTLSKSFSEFLDNLKIDNADNISKRYREITKKLNKTFRNTDSETDNCLQVGSFGRHTGIKGISDLDMLYIMPDCKWEKYKKYPGLLLRDTKDALVDRYPQTTIKVDRLVVDVFFNDFTFEVQPVFEEKDGDEINYKFPDTKYDDYRTTKPRQELEEMRYFEQDHGKTLRRLCKMMRAWKDHVGLKMGGLLLDTLAHRFLSNHSEYDFAVFYDFPKLCQDFFEFLKDEPKQDHYQALGSGQDVKVHKPFQSKAKKAYKKATEAIDEESEETRNDLWRSIFGKQFPKSDDTESTNRSQYGFSYSDPEEFIEDKYPIDIKYDLTLDCEVKRDGFREARLSIILLAEQRVARVRSLDFSFTTDTPMPYNVRWKVKNVGNEAKRRNCLRGEIIMSNRNYFERHETADFRGPHYVECYIIKDNKVVARDRIDVPIQ